MSSLTNEQLVEKAIITTDSIASSGKLNPAQSEKFINYVIQETVLKDQARIVKFRNEQLDIDKIGVGRRVAMPKAEAADPQQRRGIATSKISLIPKEIIVPFEISDNFREANIEGDDVEDTIIQMMARQLANDLEELYIGGDILGPAALQSDIIDGGDTTRYVKDNYLGLFDGWSKLADQGNLYDAGGAPIGLGVFGAMKRAMPTKFRRNTDDLRFYASPDLVQLYYEQLSARATALGDRVADGTGHRPYGIQLVEVPRMPLSPTIVRHITLNGTTPVALGYSSITNVVVTLATLGSTPASPFINVTDYVLDAALGTIARNGGGAIGNGATVKVTFRALPQLILTHRMNYIVGIGRDIRIERDRDIFKTTNQYAITCKASVQFEEASAIVKGYNIGTGL